MEKSSKETLPQQKRRWELLTQGDEQTNPAFIPEPSPVVHSFPNGWTIQHHRSPAQAHAVGKMMNNCWQGINPADPYYRDMGASERRPAFMGLHDEHGIPRAAFYQSEAVPYQSGPPVIREILGPRNQSPSPQVAQMIKDWASQNGYDFPDYLRTSRLAADVGEGEAEWVPIDAIKHLVEVDRRPSTPLTGADPDYWEKLKNHIQQYGMQNPITLLFNNKTGEAKIGEGNHRLAIAQELGLTHVPVKGRRWNYGENMKPFISPQAGDATGYFPGEFKPSYIGVPTVGKFVPSKEGQERWFREEYPERFSKTEWQLGKLTEENPPIVTRARVDVSDQNSSNSKLTLEAARKIGAALEFGVGSSPEKNGSDYHAAIDNESGFPSAVDGKRIASKSLWKMGTTYDWEEDYVPEGFFHAAPTTDRERIRKYGLQMSRPQHNPGWEGISQNEGIDFSEEPEGVYVTDNPEYITSWTAATDIWYIDPGYVRRLNPQLIKADPHSPEEWTVIEHAIPPEAIELYEPYENRIEWPGQKGSTDSAFSYTDSKPDSALQPPPQTPFSGELTHSSLHSNAQSVTVKRQTSAAAKELKDFLSNFSSRSDNQLVENPLENPLENQRGSWQNVSPKWQSVSPEDECLGSSANSSSANNGNRKPIISSSKELSPGNQHERDRQGIGPNRTGSQSITQSEKWEGKKKPLKWGFSASRYSDGYDTREFPDPQNLDQMPHKEPKGCTCQEGHKLDCPVHGLKAIGDDFPKWEPAKWTLPETHPVGLTQSGPRTWQQAYSAQSNKGINQWQSSNSVNGRVALTSGDILRKRPSLGSKGSLWKWGESFEKIENRLLRRPLDSSLHLGSHRKADKEPWQWTDEDTIPRYGLTFLKSGDAVPGGYNERFDAYHPETGDHMGHITLNTESAGKTGVIADLHVEPHARHQGVATKLWDYAQKNYPDYQIEHGYTTPEGEAWKKSLGSYNLWNKHAEYNPFYHRAPTVDRARILQHGLQPSQPYHNPHWDFEIDKEPLREQPEGVYMMRDPGKMIGADMGDVWEIDPSYLKDVYPDQLLEDWAYYTPHVIPPEALKLHNRYENQTPESESERWKKHFPEGFKDTYNPYTNRFPPEWGIGRPDRVIGSRLGSHSDGTKEGVPRWEFKSRSSSDHLLWKPGEYGKGLIDSDDDVYHWGTGDREDGEPWHAHGMQEFGIDDDNLKGAFNIDPEGVVSPRMGILPRRIENVDSRLLVPSESIEKENYFGSYQKEAVRVRHIDHPMSYGEHPPSVIGGQEKPVIYNPDNQTLYVGKPYGYHSDLIDSIPGMNELTQANPRFKKLGFGRLTAPSQRENILGETEDYPEYIDWLGEGPTDRHEIDRQLGLKGMDQWNFSNRSPNGTDLGDSGWTIKGAVQVQEVPSPEGDHGGRPLIYDPNSGTVYIGREGGYHWDMMPHLPGFDEERFFNADQSDEAPVDVYPEFYHGRLHPAGTDWYELPENVDEINEALKSQSGPRWDFNSHATEREHLSNETEWLQGAISSSKKTADVHIPVITSPSSEPHEDFPGRVPMLASPDAIYVGSEGEDHSILQRRVPPHERIGDEFLRGYYMNQNAQGYGEPFTSGSWEWAPETATWHGRVPLDRHNEAVEGHMREQGLEPRSLNDLWHFGSDSSLWTLGGRSASMEKMADKLHDFLMNPQSRPDLQTPEGQQWLKFLEHLHNEKTDQLMPWLTREWKKGRLQRLPGSFPNDTRGYSYNLPEGDPASTQGIPTELLTRNLANHWADFMNSRHPLRREMGDIMQHQIGGFHNRISEWDRALAEQEAKNVAQHGEVVHQFPNGWSVRRLHSPEELEGEGSAMQHCVGSYDKSVADGLTSIYSLRDPNGQPHVTTEIEPTRLMGEKGSEPILLNDAEGKPLATSLSIPDSHNVIPNRGKVVQIQGRTNQEPKPEYKQMMKEWFQTFPQEERPQWASSGEDWYNMGDPGEIEDQHLRLTPEEDQYGIMKPPARPQVDWDSMAEHSFHPEKWDSNDIGRVYELAKARGEVPELGEAYANKQQELVDQMSDLEDQNYDWIADVAGPNPEDDPEAYNLDPSNREEMDRAYAEWEERRGDAVAELEREYLPHSELGKHLEPHYDPQTDTYQNEIRE